MFNWLFGGAGSSPERVIVTEPEKEVYCAARLLVVDARLLSIRLERNKADSYITFVQDNITYRLYNPYVLPEVCRQYKKYGSKALIQFSVHLYYNRINVRYSFTELSEPTDGAVDSPGLIAGRIHTAVPITSAEISQVIQARHPPPKPKTEK